MFTTVAVTVLTHTGAFHALCPFDLIYIEAKVKKSDTRVLLCCSCKGVLDR